jgi:hypothetical protein
MPTLPQSHQKAPSVPASAAGGGHPAGGLCDGPPVQPGAPISRWTQLGAQDTISLRAIVAAADACPTAIVDGRTLPLLPRARATPPVHRRERQPRFRARFRGDLVRTRFAPRRRARRASTDSRCRCPRRPPAHRRVGDTGCRIKVPASGVADPIQDCASPTDWPWQRIAAPRHARNPIW